MFVRDEWGREPQNNVSSTSLEVEGSLALCALLACLNCNEGETSLPILVVSA